MERGLGGGAAEADREHRLAVLSERQFACEGHVAVGRRVVKAGQPAIVEKLPPSVRDADEADRTREERLVGGHRQKDAAAGREQRLLAFVAVAPARVVGAGVDQMGREKGEQAQARRPEVFKTDLHQHRIAARIGDNPLDQPEAAIAMRARQQKRRDAVFERLHDRDAIALLLGEETLSVRDDQAEVADAGLIDARIVDLVENAVADGEPDAARFRERRADPALGARGPSGSNSRRPGRLSHCVITWSKFRRTRRRRVACHRADRKNVLGRG